MKKIILSCLTASTLLSNLICFAQPSAVPLNFFGINGWMNDKIGNATDVNDCYGLSQTYSVNPSPCQRWGKFDLATTGIIAACPTKITNLYATMIRFGGTTNDINMPTNEQFINEIDRIRSLGAEPIIQIPYADGHYTATDAYNLIYYINVTRGKKIKYVEIGNEPDLYPDYPTNDQNRADFIANYFRPIATQVKLADNSIKIIGPSNAYYNATMFGFLLNSTNSAWIGGQDVNSHYYLDIVDFHYYPYFGSQTVANLQGNPMGTLDGYLSGLVSLINTVNGSRGGSLLQFSISEININNPNPSPNGVANNGSNGFLTGQWMAECYSVILKNGQDASSSNSKVAFVTPWSFYESSGNEGATDLGLLDGSNPCTTGVYSERSTYWHLAMMGQYFKNGTYYKGTNNSLTNVKQFGTYLANGYYAIMILNEEQSTAYATYSINTGSTLPTSSVLNIKMNMPANVSYTNSSGIAAKETQLVILDCSGNLVKRYNYASGANSPTITTGSGTPPITLSMSSVNTYCNANNGSATVSASGGAGTLVYSWAPSGGTAATASSLAAGTYTVSVHGSTCTANYSSVVTIGKTSPLVTISPINSCNSTQTFASSVSGGSGSYSYLWSASLGTGATSGTSTQPSTANAVNLYTVTVTDNTTACINTAVCSHYALHSLSVSGTTCSNQCCNITLTATYIPGLHYSWKHNGVTITDPSAHTNVLTGPYGDGTYSVTATNSSDNLDPCATVSKTYTITTCLSACQCPQGPSGKSAGVFETENTNVISVIQSLIPNPTSNTTTINYNLNKNVSNAIIVITDLYGREISQTHLTLQENKLEVDCSGLSNGIYFSTLLADGKAVSTKKLMIAK